MANNQYKNPDYKKDYNKKYLEIHGDQIKREKQEWIEANPEAYKLLCKKYTQTYYQKNKEVLKTKSLNYYYNKKNK
jgi:hypothetical protein